MSQVRQIEVRQDDDGQRLDRWLKKHVPDLPYGLQQKLIRKGQVRIDGKRVKADTRLAVGQTVRIPPVQTDDKSHKKPAKPSEEDMNFIRSLIIHDDGHIIALNKPAGLAVQGGTKTKRHIDGMLDALTGKDGVRPRLVHRLDKDTSGILLLARSAGMAKKLGQMFKKQTIQKIYWAIVSPAPDPREGTIKAPLVKAGGLNKERMRVDDKEGKRAVTEYCVLDQAAEKAAFVAFWPRTGRTHQIRVHAEILGAPIFGDRKYKQGREDIEGLDIPDSLHLHAHRVIFRHPQTGKKIDLSAPLPKDLKKTWQALGFHPNDKQNPFEDMT